MLDTPIYLGYAILDLSKLFTYLTVHDILQFQIDSKGKANSHLQYIKFEPFVLSIKTDNSVRDLDSSGDIFFLVSYPTKVRYLLRKAKKVKEKLYFESLVT